MSPEEFGFLRDMLKERSGLIVTEEKQYLLESRLMLLARKEGMQNLSALVAELKSAGAEPLRKAVTEAMTINESFFFRDKTPFENFEKIMLPELLQARAATRKLRIWCAAASTGQEPYSLAMQIRELEAQLGGWDIDILGTDLCAEVLEKAKAGLYSQFEVQRGLPIQLLVKYFKQTGSLWQIDAALRSMVRLQQFNLLDDYRGLGTFDIIFCRNVLIYFDPETKQDMLNRMALQLQGDGYLVLGAAETVIGITDQFEAVSGARGLYRKAASAASSAASPASGAGMSAGLQAVAGSAGAMAASTPASPASVPPPGRTSLATAGAAAAQAPGGIAAASGAPMAGGPTTNGASSAAAPAPGAGLSPSPGTAAPAAPAPGQPARPEPQTAPASGPVPGIQRSV
ncbi:MAG: hypothetical protein Kow0032_24230 [Methyloligellaceae bacterium]